MFWAELVMNGIGGSTVAEAKRRLSLSEVNFWQRVIDEHGTLHLGRRIEIAKMTISDATMRAAGWRTNPYMFTIFEQEPVVNSEQLKRMLRNRR